MKIGIIGCGNIGTELALFIDKNQDFELKYLFDINKKNTKKILNMFENQRFSAPTLLELKKNKPKIVSFNHLIKNSDLIIEAANKDVVEKILKNKNLDKNNKKILIMSTGGLFENYTLLKKIKNSEIHLPSGAIAGLDAIKAVSGKIKILTLTTTKPINSLQNAPYIIKNKIKINKIKKEKIIFSGNLKKAIEGFPQNINVAATLFLASKFNNLKIKIIADPKAKTNTHEIFCKGTFGEISLKTNNLPSKNPKTSYLAILSAIQVLKNMKNKIKIGN